VKSTNANFAALRPALLLLLAGTLWSFNGILIKEIHWNAFAIAGMRSLVGLIIQFSFLFQAEGRDRKKAGVDSIRPDASIFVAVLRRLFLVKDWAHWVGAVCFVLNIIALVWAFQLIKAANAVFLHYSGLLLVAIFSGPVLRQKPTRQDWISVALGLAGVLLIAVDNLQPTYLPGTALGVLCGITLALNQICLGARSQRRENGREALETIVLTNVLMTVIGLPFIIYYSPASLDPSDWMFLLLLGVIPWAVPDILYAIGIKKVPVLRALILGLLDPVLTPLWPFLFLAEVPGVSVAIGASIICGAVVFQAYYEQQQLRQA
jgi:drug/metabolite transporter, DME family